MGLCRLHSVALAVVLFAVASCAHFSGDESRDIVVFGKVQTLDFEPLDEYAISSQISARLTITRVIRGRPPSQVLTIRYIAHSDYPMDREVRFHLRRSDDGVWLVCHDGLGRGYDCR